MMTDYRLIDVQVMPSKPGGVLAVVASMLVLLSCSLGAQQDEKATPTYYSDCAYIDLGEVNDRKLTQEERIRQMELDLFDALDETEECMTSALQSGAQSIAAAAASGQGQGGGQGQGAGQGQTDSAAAQGEQLMQAQTQNTQQTQSTSGSVGQSAQTGSSAVCDAVKAGLESASTEKEKAHFKQLSEQYGC